MNERLIAYEVIHRNAHIMYDLKRRGYTHEESLMIAKFVGYICSINPEMGYEEILDAVTILMKKED